MQAVTIQKYLEDAARGGVSFHSAKVAVEPGGGITITFRPTGNWPGAEFEVVGCILSQVSETTTAQEPIRPKLTDHEREITALVAQGRMNREIAERMCIGESTVKRHLSEIFDKLGVCDRQQLALYAIHRNIRPAA